MPIDEALEDPVALGDYLRYGMGPAEKHRRALSGDVPGLSEALPLSAGGAPRLADEDLAHRYTSAYQFANMNPLLSAAGAQHAINALRSLPGPFADDPDQRAALHAIALVGSRRGRSDQFRRAGDELRALLGKFRGR